jgi:hypothetical protein
MDWDWVCTEEDSFLVDTLGIETKLKWWIDLIFFGLVIVTPLYFTYQITRVFTMLPVLLVCLGISVVLAAVGAFFIDYELSYVCPSCDDGTQNGSETGVDCGGACKSC